MPFTVVWLACCYRVLECCPDLFAIPAFESFQPFHLFRLLDLFDPEQCHLARVMLDWRRPGQRDRYRIQVENLQGSSAALRPEADATISAPADRSPAFLVGVGSAMCGSHSPASLSAAAGTTTDCG